MKPDNPHRETRLCKTSLRLLKDLRRQGLAFKGPRGWRLRGDRESIPFRTGEDLVSRGLAFEQAGAPVMLKLTSRGILLAAQLDTAAPKKRTPANSDSNWIRGGATGPAKEIRS